MPIPIFNSVASFFLKRRISQIELFKDYPIEVQQEVLRKLVVYSIDTEIGKKFEFKTIRHYNDFKERIPIVAYEDIYKDIERNRKGEQNIFWRTSIKWFAKSSGTTNAKSKFIPISFESLDDCHYKAGKDMLSLYFNNNINSELLVGKCLRLGGSKDIYENNNSYYGDLSAIMIDNLPFWAELSSTPSSRVSLISEWEKKVQAIINESIDQNVTSFAGVPSWMFSLLQQVIQQTGKDNILEIWKNAEVYFHGGVSFDPYRNLYKNLFPSKDFKYFEIFNASEGFFAIQDQNNSSELLLMLDYGIFYEFIPTSQSEQDIISLADVKLNVNYAMVITTNSGLWRYKIGDTIKFTCLNPFRIKVTGRTKHFINVFGEELVVENAEKALSMTCELTKCEISNYTVGPIFMGSKTKGSHEWLIEFEKKPDDINKFMEILDLNLQRLNSDYEAKRYKSSTLEIPKIQVARKNLFYDWLASKNKLGGQNKVPRLSNSREYLDELINLN
ncbi:GH3 auxin-responsive promoter family protein [Flavobacteriaceae bacterium]|nr:GH3 auxin-responsive promoter family protein [Flavobacteriaceae bacterium]